MYMDFSYKTCTLDLNLRLELNLRLILVAVMGRCTSSAMQVALERPARKSKWTENDFVLKADHPDGTSRGGIEGA